MVSRFEGESRAESVNQQLLKEWIQKRISAIHDRVTIHDVLRRHGVEVDREDRPTQVSCPFHGQDKNPSARVYPDSGNGPSHAWCFVCQERWDVISIWKKFDGEDKKFTRILSEIEQAFDISRPEFPDGVSFNLDGEDSVPEQDYTAFHRLVDACEGRLKLAKPVFDFRGYVSAASLLERVEIRVDDRRMSLEEGEARLRQLLENIGKKMRACPAG